MGSIRLIVFFVCSFILAAAFLGCAPAEPECVPPPPAQVTEEEPLRLPARGAGNPDADHCQACVMSEASFISCQRVWADADEDRDGLKSRAAEKACKAAGYPHTCPKEKIMMVYCKGDPLPGGGAEATAKIQRLVVQGRPLEGSAPVDVKPAPPAREPASDSIPVE